MKKLKNVILCVGKIMEQEIEQFFQELAENDRKVQAEMYTKNSDELSAEFIDFVNKNQCKIDEGDSDGK